jgi:hypothetical protein
MTEYDDVVLPDGQRHPLAGIPQAVLDAARAALREMTIESRLTTERDLDGDVDSIADSMVNALRATEFFADDSAAELRAQLVETRAALERLADPALMSAEGDDDKTIGSIRAAELADRIAYARRAWLGDRIDRFKIPTPNEEER